MASIESDVTALFASLKYLTQESAYGATLDKVLEMQHQLALLNAARKLDARDIRDAEVKIQKLEQEVKTQEDLTTSLSTTLEETRLELTKVQAQLESEKKESQDAFRAVTEELDAKTRRLEELENYRTKLISASSPRVVPAFTKLYRHAFALAQKFFGKEVEDIASNGLWGTFGDHWVVEDKIPLPLNNTKAAQHMRTAAFLGILSSELCAYVFQPSYALDLEESPEFLYRIASKEPALEAHLRSVLLRAQPETERKAEAKQRADLTAEAVMGYVRGMFNEQNEGHFRSELERLCSRASDLWLDIQTLDRVFIPVIDLDGIPDPRDWNILDFGERPAQEASSRDQESSSASSTKGGRANAAAGPAPTAERVIWPSLIMRGPTDETVMVGYALSDSQVSAGRAEKTKSPHRDTRLRRRTGSLAERGRPSGLGAPFRRANGHA